MQLTKRHLGVTSVAVLGALSLALTGLSAATAADDPGPAARTVYEAKSGPASKYVKLDLLAINDFHGQLEVVPSTSSSGRINNTPAGAPPTWPRC